MNDSKYKAQIKHLKEKYARFALNIKPDELALFKSKCAENGTTPTTEIKQFIKNYCEQ